MAYYLSTYLRVCVCVKMCVTFGNCVILNHLRLQRGFLSRHNKPQDAAFVIFNNAVYLQYFSNPIYVSYSLNFYSAKIAK